MLTKTFAINSKPTEQSFPELPEVLTWFRFVLGLAYGIFLGVKGIRNGFMVVQALNLICFVPYVYAKLYLGIAEDVYPTQVIFAGTPNAIALCLLIWIYLFTLQHSSEEGQLAALVQLAKQTVMQQPESGSDIVEQSSSVPLSSVDEPEF